jgi:hypothetical protein
MTDDWLWMHDRSDAKEYERDGARLSTLIIVLSRITILISQILHGSYISGMDMSRGDMGEKGQGHDAPLSFG